jgi:hypothetical protein
MHRHRLTGLAALISLVLAVGIGTSVAVAGGGEPPSDGDGGPNWFSDLDDAARRGAIDLELVRRLADGERVDAFIVLDGKAVMSAYGDGSVRGVAAAKAQVSAMREGLLGDVPVDVLVSYEVVPLLLVQLEYESQALALLNSSFVKAITADNQNEPALAQSLPLIRQPQVAAMGHQGNGVAVAVLDTGLDYTVSAWTRRRTMRVSTTASSSTGRTWPASSPVWHRARS